MELQEHIFSAYYSLKTNLLRTLLTLLGIIIGISSVILIISLGKGATKAVTNQLSQFGTDFFAVNPGSFKDASAFTGTVDTLTLDDAEAILSSVSNVQRVSPLANTNKIVSANGEEERHMIAGVTENYFAIVKPTIVYGREITQEDVQSHARVALIGKDTAETFYGKETDPTGEFIRIDSRPFRIIGVLETGGAFGGVLNDAVFIPLPVLNTLFRGVNYIQEMHVQVKDESLLSQTTDEVRELIRSRHKIPEGRKDDFTITSFQNALSTLESITGLLTTFVAAISGISLLVGGIGIMNIMLVTVTERTKEIGLLKAIGAKNNDILLQFLTESVVITFLGGIIGIILGIVGAWIISTVVNIPFVLSINAIIISVGVSAGVGIVFGIYPAKKAAGLNPIDALRYE